MPPLRNLAVRDLETLVHPYTNLAALRETGPLIIERAARRCQFWDHDTCVTWSWEDYFHNTRALTLTVLGCANFDSFRQLIEVQILVRALAPHRPGEH